MGNADFSTNLSRSVVLMPSALLPRSKARKSLEPASFSHAPVFTAPRLRPTMIGTCSMPTGHWNSHAPQVVHSNAASCELYLPSSGSSDFGPSSSRYPRSPRIISFGFSSLPVALAGQCSMQRPHSTQEYACRLTSCVRSLPVTNPKSSSPLSGGMCANSPREKKIVNGLNTR
jgi:hypothetical protein